jgi:hypothetical protein
MTDSQPSASDTDDAKQGLTRLAQFEDCASAIDGLFQQALGASGPSAFDELLDFVGRFNNLSVYNAMLVRVQRPGAAAVGSRRQWRERGRTVLPDAIPIVVLQLFGPVRFVYELADTEGREIPGEKASSLFAEGDLPEKVYDNTRTAAEKFGIRVIETDQYGSLLAGTAAGIAVGPEAVIAPNALRFRVKLNAKHDLPTRFATLAHELGHIYCGHIGRDPKGRWPDRSALPTELREMEAEAVAWLVCQRNGVRSRSREYLGSLVGRVDLGQVSPYAIFEAANRVEARTQPPVRR